MASRCFRGTASPHHPPCGGTASRNRGRIFVYSFTTFERFGSATPPYRLAIGSSSTISCERIFTSGSRLAASSRRFGSAHAGATLRYLPPYSPDFNPIENAISKVKAMLRKHGKSVEPEPVGRVVERTIPGPDGAIPVRVYTPHGEGPFPVIVYTHGGGWVIATNDTYDSSARALTNATIKYVVAVVSLLISMFFAWRSFYGMRIGAMAETQAPSPAPAPADVRRRQLYSKADAQAQGVD